eukprot:scaffold247356_cov14-Tisochrysis_lutea.AAC.1
MPGMPGMCYGNPTDTSKTIALQTSGLYKEPKLEECQVGAHMCREHAKNTCFQASDNPSETLLA